MRNRTAEEVEYPDFRNLPAAVSERVAAPHSGGISHRDQPRAAYHRRHHCHRSHWLAGVQALPFLGKMVREIKEWAMTKHRIEHLCWREIAWQRPFEQEAVWEVLMNLSTLSPRGAVIWETRGSGGHVIHLLGADQKHIHRIEEVFRTYGSVQFRDFPDFARKPAALAQRLKISRPVLALNTDLTASAIRAGLAAMTVSRSDEETVLQIVFGPSYAPTPTPAELPDPTASWLNILTGTVSKATAEARRTIREKAEQHRFQTTIRIGVSDGTGTRLRGILSALKVLESAGVRIQTEPENPTKLDSAHMPWHFPLTLSVKELTAFLLLPAGEEELPGTPGLHPKYTLTPEWYRSPSSRAADRSFAVSMDTAPKKLSISPRDSLEHTILLGPTGSGKSTAMQHLREAAGQTTSEYITNLLIEYYNLKKNGGTTTMSGNTRTMAFQIPEDLFQRIKAPLERETQRTGRKLTQREFVLGLIEEALNEAERLAAEEAGQDNAPRNSDAPGEDADPEEEAPEKP